MMNEWLHKFFFLPYHFDSQLSNVISINIHQLFVPPQKCLLAKKAMNCSWVRWILPQVCVGDFNNKKKIKCSGISFTQLFKIVAKNFSQLFFYYILIINFHLLCLAWRVMKTAWSDAEKKNNDHLKLRTNKLFARKTRSNYDDKLFGRVQKFIKAFFTFN